MGLLLPLSGWLNPIVATGLGWLAAYALIADSLAADYCNVLLTNLLHEAALFYTLSPRSLLRFIDSSIREGLDHEVVFLCSGIPPDLFCHSSMYMRRCSNLRIPR
jgi:hypothetical protein